MKDVEGFVFVVDSNDVNRFEEARLEFENLMQEEMPTNLLLIFANKQDLPNSRSAEEIRDVLNIDALEKIGYICKVQPSVATTGEGIFDGFHWLHNELKKIIELK